MIFNFKVNGQVLDVSCPCIVEGTIDFLDAVFNFSSEWDTLRKEAYFYKDGQTLKYDLENDKITKNKHLNLSAGEWKCYVYGIGADGMQISTDEVKINVTRTGAREGDIPPDTPTSVVDDLYNKIAEVDGKIVPPTDTMEKDNMNAIASNAVQREVGNVDTLLKTI